MLNMPGPRGSPWSLSYLLHGEDKKSIHSETTAVQIEWAKQYGQMIRLIGMLGKEKAFVLSPTALQKVYVTDWLDYPRVSILKHLCSLILSNIFLPAWTCKIVHRTHCWFRAINQPWRRTQSNAPFYEPCFLYAKFIRSLVLLNRFCFVGNLIYWKRNGNVL